MSVMIKDMEMPTNCTRCPCCDDDVRFCKAAGEYIPMLGKPNFCPLAKVAPRNLPSTQPEPSQVARDIATIIENEQDMRVIARSTQPEPLTDKEQRIFLTAMAREEKVCRQVDDECRDRTPYEVSLVHVCKEIRRKVKGALWA